MMTKAMRGTMGAQSRNRVGRREWTLLRMGKVFIEKLVFDWRLDLDNYQVLRDKVKKRETSWSTDTAKERVTKSERLRFQKRQRGMLRKSPVKGAAGPSSSALRHRECLQS